jgi:predicted enzyme related to lactoylglutathione lyase
MQNLTAAGAEVAGRALRLALPAVLVSTLACASGPKVVLPAVTPTPTDTHHLGKFVWRDLLTHDLAGAKRFYGGLFGWEFEASASNDSTYTIITHSGVPIGGIVYMARSDEEANRSQWVSYMSVADVDLAAAQVRGAGGVVHTGPRDYPDRGRIAVVSDPQGALVALVRSTAGDPADAEPDINQWLWTELWTTDVPAAVSFYQTMVGYEFEMVEIYEQNNYGMFNRDGQPRAGVLELPLEGVRPNWLAYIRVQDPAAVAARVDSLGGSLFLAPDDNVRNGDVAVIVDPSGAALTVQRWPPRTEEGRGEG